MGIRISEMEEAASFGEEDLIPIVKNGSNKKALGSKIKDFIAGFFVAKDDNSRLITSLGQTFTDCDAVMTAGMYYNNLANVTNAPAGTMVSANSGQLIVTQRASDVRVFQTLYVYVGNGNKTEIYVRAQKNATSFADWTQLAKTDGSNISDAAAFRSAIGITTGNITAVSGITLNYGKWFRINDIVTINASIITSSVIGANTILLKGIPTVGNDNVNGILIISSTFANTKINNAYIARIYGDGLYINAGNELPAGTWIINGQYRPA